MNREHETCMQCCETQGVFQKMHNAPPSPVAWQQQRGSLDHGWGKRDSHERTKPDLFTVLTTSFTSRELQRFLPRQCVRHDIHHTAHTPGSLPSSSSSRLSTCLCLEDLSAKHSLASNNESHQVLRIHANHGPKTGCLF